MADGCPSGHGLSGMMQLSVSAFVALGMFFSVHLLTVSGRLSDDRELELETRHVALSPPIEPARMALGDLTGD